MNTWYQMWGKIYQCQISISKVPWLFHDFWLFFKVPWLSKTFPENFIFQGFPDPVGTLVFHLQSFCVPHGGAGANHNTKEHTGLCVSQNINSILIHYLILLISIAANKFYVYKSLWVPHAGTGPNNNTQWHSELCFSLNSLTLLCQMSVYANRHA